MIIWYEKAFENNRDLFRKGTLKYILDTSNANDRWMHFSKFQVAHMCNRIFIFHSM